MLPLFIIGAAIAGKLLYDENNSSSRSSSNRDASIARALETERASKKILLWQEIEEYKQKQKSNIHDKYNIIISLNSILDFAFDEKDKITKLLDNIIEQIESKNGYSFFTIKGDINNEKIREHFQEIFERMSKVNSVFELYELEILLEDLESEVTLAPFEKLVTDISEENGKFLEKVKYKYKLYSKYSELARNYKDIIQDIKNHNITLDIQSFIIENIEYFEDKFISYNVIVKTENNYLGNMISTQEKETIELKNLLEALRKEYNLEPKCFS